MFFLVVHECLYVGFVTLSVSLCAAVFSIVHVLCGGDV